MKIIVLVKGRLENLPPLITVAHLLVRCNYEVNLITSVCHPSTKSELNEAGVKVLEIEMYSKYPMVKLYKKMHEWILYAAYCWQYIKKQKGDYLLWIGSADTAIALGKRLLKENYVLEVLELYDRFPLYRYLLGDYMRNARANVVPNESRAGIFRVWYGLNQSPFVLPNKPLELNYNKLSHGIDSQVRQKLNAITGKKLLLYQAANIRMDLTVIARAVESLLGHDYLLGTLGRIRDMDMYERVCKITAKRLHFDYTVPPYHLAITRSAHIGIMIYSYESLNNLFCAPNKMWEYSSYGIPLLCNKLPEIQYQLEKYNAGLTYEETSPEEFANAVRNITENYDLFSTGSKALYSSIDLQKIIKDIVAAAISRIRDSRNTLKA